MIGPVRLLLQDHAGLSSVTDSYLGDSEYSAPEKNSALPGTDCPASERLPDVMRSAIQDGAFFPRPTSIREPTMARTMLRRKRFALILNTI